MMDSDLEVAKCFFLFGRTCRERYKVEKKVSGYGGRGIRGQYPDLFLLLLANSLFNNAFYPSLTPLIIIHFTDCKRIFNVYITSS